MAKVADNKDKLPVEKHLYNSHTIVRFTHNKKDYCLQYGVEYTDLPSDSSIIKNLIHQKRLIKI